MLEKQNLILISERELSNVIGGNDSRYSQFKKSAGSTITNIINTLKSHRNLVIEHCILLVAFGLGLFCMYSRGKRNGRNSADTENLNRGRKEGIQKTLDGLGLIGFTTCSYGTEHGVTKCVLRNGDKRVTLQECDDGTWKIIRN